MTNTDVVITSISGIKVNLAVAVPVEDNRKKCIQSIVCKSKDKITVLAMTNQIDAAKKKCDELAQKYRDLVEPALKAQMPGLSFTWTSRDSSGKGSGLMGFNLGTEQYQVEFEVKAESTKTEEVEDDCEDIIWTKHGPRWKHLGPFFFIFS